MSAMPDERPPTPDELAELMQPGADWEKDGFHPTMYRPFPSMQCTGVVKSGPRSGQRCSKRAIYGASVCLEHGGHLPSVRNKATTLVTAARLRLVGDLDEATDHLEDLMRNSSSDSVRLKAVEMVYDRAGLRGGTELDITVEDARLDPAALLRDRIAKTRERVLDVTAESSVTVPLDQAEPDVTVDPVPAAPVVDPPREEQ